MEPHAASDHYSVLLCCREELSWIAVTLHTDGRHRQRATTSYLNTTKLLASQKPFDSFCNHDELQFQIVHQIEELWLKLAGYTLLEVDEEMAVGHTLKVLTLMQRVHRIERLMTDQLSLLETMSPKDYQAIRLLLTW